jgi:hypothetical protein
MTGCYDTPVRSWEERPSESSFHRGHVRDGFYDMMRCILRGVLGAVVTQRGRYAAFPDRLPTVSFKPDLILLALVCLQREFGELARTNHWTSASSSPRSFLYDRGRLASPHFLCYSLADSTS